MKKNVAKEGPEFRRKGRKGRTEYSRQFWLLRGWNFARLEDHLGLEEVGASAESVILSKTSGLVKWRA